MECQIGLSKIIKASGCYEKNSSFFSRPVVIFKTFKLSTVQKKTLERELKKINFLEDIFYII